MLSNVSILKAETTELKEARLALVEAFSNVLFKGLSLLGMTPPERM
jgi:arginyl-tRNA synthetase